MAEEQPKMGSKVAAALAAGLPLLRQMQARSPEFVTYCNSLDAMQLHIARCLLYDLKIPSHYIPALVAAD